MFLFLNLVEIIWENRGIVVGFWGVGVVGKMVNIVIYFLRIIFYRYVGGEFFFCLFILKVEIWEIK